jgi:hypothetical protein
MLTTIRRGGRPFPTKKTVSSDRLAWVDFLVIGPGAVTAIAINSRQPESPPETALRKRRIFVLIAMSRKGNCRSPPIGVAINNPFTNDADVSEHH